MTEVIRLDHSLGPVLPAAEYLAVCAWPDSEAQRRKLVAALLHAGARAAGYRHPGPDLRVIQRRIDRATDRLEQAFQAAEVLQLAIVPPELQLGNVRVLMPSRHTVGRGGRVSVKRLQAFAANYWKLPVDCNLADGDPEFQRRVWKRFLPVLACVIPLKLYVESNAVDIVTLVRDTSWLEPALADAERWAAIVREQTNFDTDFIQLKRE